MRRKKYKNSRELFEKFEKNKTSEFNRLGLDFANFIKLADEKDDYSFVIKLLTFCLIKEAEYFSRKNSLK